MPPSAAALARSQAGFTPQVHNVMREVVTDSRMHMYTTRPAYMRAEVYIRACACGLECDTTPLGPPMAVAPASICIRSGLGRTLMHTPAMAAASAQA